jgi:hypothetical protein
MSLGDCYPAAFNLLVGFLEPASEVEGGLLVHGRPLGTGGEAEGIRCGHAWVEKGGYVFDWSNGKQVAVPRPLYYTAGTIDPDECHYYTREEAIHMALMVQHYGPWDDWDEADEAAEHDAAGIAF